METGTLAVCAASVLLCCTQGLLKVAPDWTATGNRVLLDTTLQGHRRGACTASQDMGLLRERVSVSSSHTTNWRTPSARIPFHSPYGSPSDLEASGFARTTSGDFYGSLNDGSEVWLGLYWLNVHDEVAEWVAVDTPGNLKNGIRIFGSSGDDLVYARVAWQWPEQLEFLDHAANYAVKIVGKKYTRCCGGGGSESSARENLINLPHSCLCPLN